MVADARLSTMSLAADAPRPPRPGPGLAVSIAVIIIAAAIGITGLVIGVTSVVHRVRHFNDGPQGSLPAHISAPLTPATWQIYVETNGGLPDFNDDPGFPNDGGGNDFGIDASDVSVTAPDGTSVAVRDLPSDLTETEDLGSHSYLAVARFDISQPGLYEVDVRAANGDAGTRVLVGKSLGSDLIGVVKWLVMAGIGFLLGVVGIVLLIVGIVRRRGVRRRLAYGGLTAPGPGFGGGYFPGGGMPMPTPAQPAPSAPPGLPPPGWFDDPHLPGMQRYWDGARWTDQTRNTT
jgi:hypothetical protein